MRPCEFCDLSHLGYPPQLHDPVAEGCEARWDRRMRRHQTLREAARFVALSKRAEYPPIPLSWAASAVEPFAEVFRVRSDLEV